MLNDTLPIVCMSDQEFFLFKTDVDSIQFKLQPGKSERFYVLLKDSLYAHTIIQGVKFQSELLAFEAQKSNPQIEVAYSSSESQYLQDLSSTFPVNHLLEGTQTEFDKILNILNWTNSRWEHNGNNSPKKNDAISILKEAEAGNSFPCFAYAIVLRDQLNALGFKARTIYLKSKDAATRTYSPGHVATEVYLNKLKKWIFLDGQFNVIPILHDIPLNAVEFQKAIGTNYDQLVLASKEAIDKRDYVEFVYDYLYYLDTSLDHGYESKEKKNKIDGKSSLMLVPLGAENLTRVNFWDLDVDYCLYTNSLKDFYRKPI